jgi:hypothetical protein
MTAIPAASVGKKMGKARKARPLLWTTPRIERWRETGQIPGRVMVWSRERCGEFLDGIEDERLYALYPPRRLLRPAQVRASRLVLA